MSKYFSVETKVLGGLPVLAHVKWDDPETWEIERYSNPKTGKSMDFIFNSPRYDERNEPYLYDDIVEGFNDYMIGEAEFRYESWMDR